MPEITVQIKNMPQIRSAFRQAPVLMTNNLNKAIRKSIFTIQSDSMRTTPVLTGRLRGSHTTLFGILRGELWLAVYYALFVHEGTRFMRARPFLFNAVQKDQSQVDRYLEQAVQDTLDTIGGQT